MRQSSGWNWQKACLDANGLTFEHKEGLDQALRDGFFFVRTDSEMDLNAGDAFAQNFYLPRTSDQHSGQYPYRGFHHWLESQLGKHQGYFLRDEDQTEQFFLESASWSSVFPPELTQQAKTMRTLALEVLRAVLVHLEIPEELWDKATGGNISGRGTYTLTFNHFRPEKEKRGLNVHKDSGWVTILRSIEPGLEARQGDSWHPVDPIEGMFIVNFGCAMEILTRRTRRPVAAVPHRVVQQPVKEEAAPDRFSYALFVDSSLDENVSPGLFAYDDETGLQFESRFDEFLDTILANTYDRDGVGLY